MAMNSKKSLLFIITFQISKGTWHTQYNKRYMAHTI
jgi:hypothetical protein